MVCDSNVFIDWLNGKLDPFENDRLIRLAHTETGIISIITNIEVLAGKDLDKHSLQTLTAFMSLFRMVELTTKYIITAVVIRRDYNLKLPDAVIAATALDMGLPLLTSDTKRFDRVPGLEIVRPIKIA